MDVLELLNVSEFLLHDVESWYDYLSARKMFLKIDREKILCYSVLLILQKHEWQRPLSSLLLCFEYVTYKDIVRISSALTKDKSHKFDVYQVHKHDLSQYICALFDISNKADIDQVISISAKLFDNRQISKDKSYIMAAFKILNTKYPFAYVLSIMSKKLVMNKSELKRCVMLYL